ncbi:hypothetical protein [Cryobacterium sp. BB736]|uniref:hypothetical protein n=1 Tax=Cryobacterium sp. BB736 TaxID=2746963 RepID=UPI001874C1BC|nr:hypothetical protein [Cryobacterium sp. BB736]
MSTRWARVARGQAAALVSTFIAAFSHAAADGDLPGPAGILLCLAFSGMLCVALAGKRLSRMRLAVSIALSQFAFHAFFSSLSAPIAAVPVAAHAHPGGLAGLQPLAPTVHAVHAVHAGETMWLAHVVAAVITFLILRFGERAFWSLFETARLSVGALLNRLLVAPVALPRQASGAQWSRSVVPRALRRMLSPMRHRGPPLALFA